MPRKRQQLRMKCSRLGIFSERLRARRLAVLLARDYASLSIPEFMQLDELKRQQKWGRDYELQPRLWDHLSPMIDKITIHNVPIVDWDNCDRDGICIWKCNIASGRGDNVEDPFTNPPCSKDGALFMLNRVVMNTLESPSHYSHPLRYVAVSGTFAFCVGRK